LHELTICRAVGSVHKASRNHLAKPTGNHQDRVKLLKVPQLAEMINISPKTIYDWVHKGRIPHYKLEGSLRFDVDEVKRWLRSKRRRVRGRVDIL
jgi:excisionase family DNA binding protein